MTDFNRFKTISRTAAALSALAIGALAFFSCRGRAAAAVSVFHDAADATGAGAAGAEDTGARRRRRPRGCRAARTFPAPGGELTRPARRPGTVIVDTPNTYLYLIMGNGQAMRYGIGVGRDGFTWSGVQTVTRKAEWPAWTPPARDDRAANPYLPRHMAGGPGNPLGARRAMYLGGTIYRIHGTNMPENHRHPGIIGLHPPHQPGRLGSVRTGECRHQGDRAADGPPRRHADRPARLSHCGRKDTAQTNPEYGDIQ